MKALLVLTLLALTTTIGFAQSPLKWVRTNHPSMTSALSFSSDGKYLASTSYGYNEVILWDGQTGKFIERMRPIEPLHIGGAEFIPGTKLLALGGDSGIFCYDVETKMINGVLPLRETHNLVSLDISSTGDTIGWLTQRERWDESTVYYLYDRIAQRIFDSIPMYGQGIDYVFNHTYLASRDLNTIVFKQSNDTLVLRSPYLDTFFVSHFSTQYLEPHAISAAGDYVIFINRKSDMLDSLDLVTRTFTRSIASIPTEHQRPFVAALSPDGRIRVFADNRNWMTPEYGVSDGYIMVVRNNDTSNITGLVGGIASSPIEARITVGGNDGLAAYSYEGEELSLGKTYNGMGVTGLSYSYAGELSYIALGDMSSEYTHYIHVGDKAHPHHMAGQFFHCFNIPKIDPAANRFAMGLEILSRDTGWFAMRCPVVTSEWTPSGSHYIYSTFSDTLVFQDRANNQVPVLTGHRKILNIAVSTRHDLIATAGMDSTIKLWTLDGQLVKTFIGHTTQVNDVTFAPSGRQLVSASSDSTIRVWDIDKGEIYKYTQFREPFWQAAVSNDGLTVIGASDRSIVGFNAAEWASVKPVAFEASNSIRVYSSNGVVTIEHDLEQDKPVQLEVYDLIGRLLHRAEYTSNRITFHASGYSNSPLIFTVSQDGKSATAIVPKL
ncbi:MAG TPA: WD40 repeat domain-containing protein [Candidatus Kapabacteria bacterium]|nr:WD40 repeat domain-containing protein [Candidatus Kapabacteria bacterium]